VGIFGPFLHGNSGNGGAGPPGPPGAPGAPGAPGVAGAAAATPFVFEISGPYAGSIVPGTFGAPLVVDSPFTVAEVRISRRTAGSSGTTTVDILKNGVSIFSGPPPFILASSGNYAGISVAAFSPAILSFGPGDVLDVLLLAVESFGVGPPFGPEGLKVEVVPVANGAVGPIPEILRWGIIGPLVAPVLPGFIGEAQRIYQPRVIGTVTLSRTKRGANTLPSTKIDILAGPPGGPLVSIFGINPLPEVVYADGQLAVSAKTVFATASWPSGTLIIPQLVTVEDFDGLTQGPDGIGVSVYMT